MYFNSIKVRLEQDEQAGRKLQTTFQFHKGAIRTGRWHVPSISNPDFNSIKVRLEQLKEVLAIVNDKFQFHKGAIRTLRPEFFHPPPTAFQFHKGAIRTSLAATFFTCSEISIP